MWCFSWIKVSKSEVMDLTSSSSTTGERGFAWRRPLDTYTWKTLRNFLLPYDLGSVKFFLSHLWYSSKILMGLKHLTYVETSIISLLLFLHMMRIALWKYSGKIKIQHRYERVKKKTPSTWQVLSLWFPLSSRFRLFLPFYIAGTAS